MHIPRLNALKFLQWKGARMVEEVGELDLGDELPESIRSLTMDNVVGALAALI